MQDEGGVRKGDPAYAGQAGYTAAGLRAYDFIAYRITGPLFWGCSKEALVAHYDRNVRARHLDIGVGTGYLLDRCRFPAAHPEITLMDLNSNSLGFTARRLRRYAPRLHTGNIAGDWGLEANAFESVAMSNVLHCAPGSLSEKAVALDQAHSVLVPGGVLFGSTVLGKGVTHTRRSRSLMKRLNRRGVFCNLDDDIEDLEARVARNFASYELEVHGTVALFAATVGG